MKTILVGLGNPILGDDGVGPRIAAELEKAITTDAVSVVAANVGGLGLVELLLSFERALIIDAVQTVDGTPGQIHRFDAGTLQSSRRMGPLHDLDLAAALDLYVRMGMAVPRQIVVFAIEVADVTTFCEECTPAVKAAIPICVGMVLEELGGMTS
jgi:hydrogenase maturation protease